MSLILIGHQLQLQGEVFQLYLFDAEIGLDLFQLAHEQLNLNQRNMH
jgi:hypothetical protein